jgi:hypothetical protein
MKTLISALAPQALAPASPLHEHPIPSLSRPGLFGD